MNKGLSIQILCAVLPALAVLVLSGNVRAQELSRQRYIELIEQKQDEAGNTAPELVELLTALGQVYVEEQDFERAAESFERARTIMRVNSGFDTPQELPLLARQVAAEEARGNIAGAWALEESLLQLAAENIGSLEALPVFLAAAEKRMDIWNRYRSGEHPPEIELGCYYDRTKYISGMLSSLPSAVVPTELRSECSAGERQTVLIALLVDVRRYQMLGVETLLQNDRYASDELYELVIDVLRTSDGIARRQLSSADPALSQMIVRLLRHEPSDSAAAVRRAEFHLQLADANVVRARLARRMVGFDVVHEQYEQVWHALEAEGVGGEALNELFAPQIPVVLPSYATNPLARVSEAEATGYIDVAFKITDKGTTRSVDIVGSSANMSRSEIRQLQRLVDISSFRPRMADGKVLDMVPVTVRYYVKEQLPEEDAQDP